MSTKAMLEDLEAAVVGGLKSKVAARFWTVTLLVEKHPAKTSSNAKAVLVSILMVLCFGLKEKANIDNKFKSTYFKVRTVR